MLLVIIMVSVKISVVSKTNPFGNNGSGPIPPAYRYTNADTSAAKCSTSW